MRVLKTKPFARWARKEKLARVYLAMGEDTVEKLLKAGELMEAKDGNSKTA